MLKDTLKELVAETAKTLGYNLVETAYSSGRGRSQLKVIIHSTQGISTEDCSRVASVLSRRLDVDDLIPAAFDLVVESPGVEYVFREPQHYEIFRDQEVVVTLKEPAAYALKDHTVQGINRGLREEKLSLETAQGQEILIALQDISRTRLYFNIKKYL